VGPGEDFEVVVERSPGRLIVRPVGELDISTVDRVRGELGARDDQDSLVLDFSRLGFLDTSGLQLVVEMYRRSRAEGWTLTVVRGPSSVQRVFEIAGLEGVLPFTDELPGG
jgi:anti-anti-sigma factor